MKKVACILLLFCIIYRTGFTQSIPVVEADVLTESCPSDKENSKFDRYWKIYASMHNEN